MSAGRAQVQGLPKNTTAMDGSVWSEMDFLQVSLENVRGSFRRYQLLDSKASSCAPPARNQC